MGARTEPVDAAGRTLAPGYIGPHAHPWNLATPAALARRVLPLGALAERELRALLRQRGYAFHDPIYTMLFLSADFLPSARLSSLGVWDVKRRRVLLPSRRRAPRD